MKDIQKVHKITGIVAMVTLTTFFLSTVIVESSGNHESIKLLKLLIMIFALGVMVPSTIMVGKTGKKIVKGYDPKLLKKKLRLFKFIQRIGPFVLGPTGVALYFLARSDSFNTVFYTIQAIELVAQLSSITLLIIGIKTGIQLKKLKK